jgi:hypothetical protein
MSADGTDRTESVLDGEDSYWCAQSALHSDVVGSYDGVEAWTIHAAALVEEETQAMVSIDERLHHKLQHTTPWGLVTRWSTRPTRPAPRALPPSMQSLISRSSRNPPTPSASRDG